jgi:hypothetical protein
VPPHKDNYRADTEKLEFPPSQSLLSACNIYLRKIAHSPWLTSQVGRNFLRKSFHFSASISGICNRLFYSVRASLLFKDKKNRQTLQSGDFLPLGGSGAQASSVRLTCYALSPIFSELISQRADRNAEHFRCLRAVIVILLQRAENGGPLNFL